MFLEIFSKEKMMQQWNVFGIALVLAILSKCKWVINSIRRDIYSKLKIIKVHEISWTWKRKQCSNDMKCSCQITAVAPSLSLSTNCWLTRSDERLQLASLDNSKDGSKIFDKSLPQHHWIILIEGIKKNFVVIGAWWTCYIIGAKKDDQSSMTAMV